MAKRKKKPRPNRAVPAHVGTGAARPAAPADRPTVEPPRSAPAELQKRFDALQKALDDTRTETGASLERRVGDLRAELVALLDEQPSRLARVQRRLEDTLDDYETIAESLPTGGIPVLRQRIGELEALHASDAEQYAALVGRLRQLELSLAQKETEIERLRSHEGRALREDLEEERRRLAEQRVEVADVQRLRTENAILQQQVEELRRAERAVEAAVRDRTELSRLQETVDELDANNRALQLESNRLRQRLRGVERLEAQRDDLQRQLADLAEFETQRDELVRHLAEARERARGAEDEVVRLRHEIDQLRSELREARSTAEQAVEEARDLVTEEVREAHLERARRREEEHERARAEWDRRREELEEQRAQAERRAADLASRLDAARRERDLEWDRVKADVEQFRAEELAAAREEKGALDEAVAQLRGQCGQLEDGEREARERFDALREEVARLTAELQARRGEVERLEARERELRHIDLPRQERLESLRRPVLDRRPVGPEVGELEWLESVRRGIEDAGFVFPERLLHAFHTSLKTASIAPITVLAGISGTGKSELPRLYADLGGLHFRNIAVQPSWDSPDDLFGFFNYTDGRYRATELSRLLHQVSGVAAEESLEHQVVLVLLDEMNIARVEYYFAELLSRLETRRGLSRGQPGWERGAIRIDAGATDEHLFLDHNVLFVGTMNEDESTLTLSDKVKDRASVITFPSPRRFHDREATKVARARDEALARSNWEDWQRSASPLTAKRLESLEEHGHAFNEALARVGRAIGHRVFQAVRAYVAQYPRVADEEQTFARALSDAYALKLLPKLIGIEPGSVRGSDCLDLIEQRLPDDLRRAFAEARGEEYFGWYGSREVFEASTKDSEQHSEEAVPS